MSWHESKVLSSTPPHSCVLEGHWRRTAGKTNTLRASHQEPHPIYWTLPTQCNRPLVFLDHSTFVLSKDAPSILPVFGQLNVGYCCLRGYEYLGRTSDIQCRVRTEKGKRDILKGELNINVQWGVGSISFGDLEGDIWRNAWWFHTGIKRGLGFSRSSAASYAMEP